MRSQGRKPRSTNKVDNNLPQSLRKKGRTAKSKSQKDWCCEIYKSRKIILPLLVTLAELSASQRTFMLAHLDEKTLRTICSVIDKVLHGNFPRLVKENLSKKLKANKKVLRSLCCYDTLSENSIRKQLTEMGGGPMKLIFNSAVPLYAKW